MRRTRTRRSRTSSISARRLRAPRASMRPILKSQAASASDCSLPRPTAIRTSAMRARTSTRAVCKPGVPEDQNGRRKWAAIKKSVAAFDPALNARDDKEEARAGNIDHRYNHWTAVRDGLMNAHADIFPKIPGIVKALPDPIDQMKLFELIQIIPSPTKSALGSRNLLDYRVSDPTDHGLSAKQQHVHLRTGRPGQNICNLPRNSRCDVAVQRKVRTRARQIRRGQEAVQRLNAGRQGPDAMTPDRQSGPSMAHRGSQNVLTAAATPLLMMFRRSGEFIWSSSSRLMIEPASSSTAAIRVFLSTISSS